MLLSAPAPLSIHGQVIHWNFASTITQDRIVQDSSGIGESTSGVANHGLLSGQGTSFVKASPSLNPGYPCGSVYSGVWRFAAPEEYVTALRGDSAYGGRLQFRCDIALITFDVDPCGFDVLKFANVSLCQNRYQQWSGTDKRKGSVESIICL